MNRPVQRLVFSLIPCAIAIPTIVLEAAAAPIVWTGSAFSFSKSSGANPTLPANQDQLTANVSLTRGNTQGMFNILKESNFTLSSPADTQWATALNNPGDTISAANWAALDFTTWSAAYLNNVSANILNHGAVVHLVTDDIYLDLRFTSFQGGGSGGAFSYERSTPVPEPAALTIYLTAGAIRLRQRTRQTSTGSRGRASE
ncbi:MAG: hypothetical protein AB7G28_02035 [Pirellulales bacterium]